MYSAVLQTGLACCIPTLYGLLPSYMRCIVEWNVIISARDCIFETEIVTASLPSRRPVPFCVPTCVWECPLPRQHWASSVDISTSILTLKNTIKLFLFGFVCLPVKVEHVSFYCSCIFLTACVPCSFSVGAYFYSVCVWFHFLHWSFT